MRDSCSLFETSSATKCTLDVGAGVDDREVRLPWLERLLELPGGVAPRLPTTDDQNLQHRAARLIESLVRQGRAPGCDQAVHEAVELPTDCLPYTMGGTTACGE